MRTCKEAERSIVKTYRKEIWARFVRSIKNYDMIQENDRIAVCISGGKDSMILAKCFQELKRHGKMNFDLEFIVMDPGYNQANRKRIEENAAHLEIPIKIFEVDLFNYVHTVEDSPCYICARMRRGNLYSIAQSLGCNKIALGHHFDDVIETILMGMLYGGQIQTMMPKLHSDNFEGMELIRPLYLVKEEDILRWCRHNELEFIRCACRFTEEDEINHQSKRSEMKELVKKFRTINPYIEYNIFKSVENVNLSTVISYKLDGEVIHFLDHYNDGKEEHEKNPNTQPE